jgi:hypothetical protein
MLRFTGLDMAPRKTEATGGGDLRPAPDREKQFTTPGDGHDPAFFRCCSVLRVCHRSSATERRAPVQKTRFCP